ncbi:unnamed protein product [Soboliphyme baturini]|uniref:PDZ domain-containing protein n=1 Tax=Soboliphyme baturini TaxID=241478 RepID=A0A183J5C8_9BILA|nr:unnamed protein product [Soboliphyme baturini]
MVMVTDLTPTEDSNISDPARALLARHDIQCALREVVQSAKRPRLWMEVEASTSSYNPARWSELKESSLSCGGVGANLKVVKLTKDGDLPLGATVKNSGEAIVIGRIVRGGVAEKSKLLSEGDEIIEVNGIDMRGKSVNEVCDLLVSNSCPLQFPSSTQGRCFRKHLRSLFNYDPEDDPYLPCRELGLGFSKGDVLHVISVKDPNWWQAYREGEDSTQSLAGLIPSPSFQLQREEYNRELFADDKDREYKTGGLLCKSKKKRTSFIRARKSASAVAIERQREVLIYEEVSLYLSRTGRRRPIVLIGPPHVGCLELRQRLMETEAEKFAGVVPRKCDIYIFCSISFKASIMLVNP